MSNPLVVDPGFSADRHFSEEEFQPIKNLVNKKECREEDYQAAIELLFGLFEEMSQGRDLSLLLLYHYLLLLLPHFDEEKFTALSHNHLSNLLHQSPDHHDEHRKLALVLGAWKLSHARDESLGSVLQACREAMDFYVEAISIAEEHQLEIDETHRQASIPFVKVLKCTIGQGRPIKKRILEATRSWQQDPEQFFKAYEAIEKLIEKLTVFNCGQEGEEVIKEVYQQVLGALNASTPEFKAQTRFVQGKFYEQLRVKLSNAISQPACWATQRYRTGLKAFREAFSSSILDDVRAFQKGTTQAFVSFFQNTFFRDIEAIFLHTFPGRFDLRAMGSIGKKEGCLSSDLEYLILIDDETHRGFFKNVADALEMMFISLGETPLSTRSLNTLRLSLPIKIKKGLHVDLGGNPAQHSEALIRTPSRMADLQIAATDGPCSFENTTRKSISLINSEGAEDESALYKTYQSCLGQILDPEDGPSLRQEKAIIFMLRRLETYGDMPSPFTAPNGEVDLKAQFIEPLFHLISDMALYWNVPGNNTLDLIDGLAQKGLFSDRSKELLIEAVSFIYSMRVNLHGVYKEQKDVVAYGTGMPSPGCVWINEEKRQKLEKIYWLVIRPLYTSLKNSMVILPYPPERSVREEWEQRADILILRSSEKGVKPTFVRKVKSLDEACMNIDLVGLGFGEIFTSPPGQPPKFFRPLIKHIALHLAQIHAPEKDHKEFFEELSENQTFESLREIYLTTLEQEKLDLQSVIQTLSLVPNVAGLRLASIRSAQRLQLDLINEMTDPTPEAREDKIEVKVSSPYFEKPRFLKSALIDEILETKGHKRKVFTGALKQDVKYKDSLHNVTQWKRWHFKQLPTHFFQEYAIHDLGYRLGGVLTPEVELVRFDVNIPGVKPYPVTISETIGEGKTLMDWNKRPEAFQPDPVQLTWLILLTLITRAGDGRPSNYPIDKLKKIYCVDNEHSFSQLLSGSVKWTVEFFSALFCLGETELDRGVLEVFKDLNAKAILSAWIDQVITKEELYKILFPKKEERGFLFGDKDQRCKLSFVLREGVLTTVLLQFVRLQEFIKVQLSSDPPVKITAQMLLSQLVDIRPDFDVEPYGKRVSAYYVKSLSAEKAINARLEWLAGRPAKTRPSVDADKAAFANPPTFEEIEEGKYSARKAKDELNAIIFGDNFHVAEDALTVNCLGLENHRTKGDSSHTQVLRAALLQSQGKCKVLIFRHCDALNQANLILFLHEKLESLTIEYCSHFDLDALNAVVARCPLLRNLTLVNCSDLQPSIFGRPRINAPLLETVHIEGCQKLASLEITTFAIKKITLVNNPLLQEVEVKTNHVPQLDLDPYPKIFTFTEQDEVVADLRRAVQAGNAKAQFRLGKLLLKRNVSEQAVGWEWMKKSADQNHAPAMFFLGLWEFIKGGAMHGQSLKAAADQGYFAALGALDILECIRRSQSRFQVAFHPGRIEKNLSELVHTLADLDLIENIGRGHVVLYLLRGVVHDMLGNYRPAVRAFMKVSKVPLAEQKRDEVLAHLMKIGFQEEVSWDGHPGDIVDMINKSSLYRERKMRLLTGQIDGAFLEPADFIYNPVLRAYRGEAHMMRGNFTSALVDLKDSIAEQPLFFSFLARGELHRAQGNYDLALQDFTQAIKKNPRAPIAWARRGEICLLLCYFSRAAHDLSKAMELDPSLEYTQFLMKTLQSIRKDGDPNATILDRLWKMEKNRLFIFGLRANYYLLKNNLPQAETYLKVLLQGNPSYPFGLARRGELYRLKGDASNARLDFYRVTGAEPTHAYALSRIAEIDRLAKRREALQKFEEVLKLDPDNCFAKSRRGTLLFDLGETQEAFDEMDQTLQMEPDNGLARTIRGEIHRLEGRLDNALSDFNQILRSDPDNDFVLSRRGFVFVSKRLPDDAQEDFVKAKKLNEQNIFAMNGCGEMARWKGLDEYALTFFTQVLALDSKNVFALGREGDILFRRGEKQKGLESLKKALQIDPNDRFALKAFAECYRLMGELDETIKLLTTAITLDPSDVDALIDRAATWLRPRPYSYDRQERIGKALADLEVALKLRPGDLKALTLRGEAYQLKGELVLALSDLNIVLKRYSYDKDSFGSRALRSDRLEADALIRRAAVYRAMHIHQWSLDDLNAALLIRPDDLVARQARGEVRQLSGHPEAALKDLADIKTREACVACAAAYRDKGDYAEALKKLILAETLGARENDLRPLRGELFRLMGDHEKAAEYVSLWSQDPDDRFRQAATRVAKRDFKDCFYWLEHALSHALPHLGLVMMTHRRVPFLKKHREAIDVVDQELQKAEDCEDVFLLRALVAIAIGRADLAAQYLSHALKINPQERDIMKLLARVNLAMGRHSAALHHFLTAELQEHFYGVATHLLGWLVKDDTLILKFFEKNLKRHPGHAQLLQRRAAFYLAKEDYRAALGDLEQLLSQQPALLFARKAKAFAHYQLKDFDAALVECEEVLRLKSGSVFALKLRGEIHLSRKAFQKASDDFSSVLDQMPEDIRSLKKRGKAHEELADLPAAVRDYDQVLQLLPADVPTLRWRAEVHKKLKNFARVLEDYDRIQALMPDDIPVKWDRWRICLELEDHDATLRAIDQFLTLQPTNHEALREKAKILFDMGKYEDALEVLKLNSAPDDMTARQLRADIYCKTKDYQKALNELNQILDEWEWDTESREARGKVHYALGDYDSALSDFTSQHFLSDDPEVLTCLGNIYRMKNKFDKAKACADRALKIKPNDREALVLRGELFRVMEDYGQALKDLQRVYDQNPNYDEILQNRGNDALAMKDLEPLFMLHPKDVFGLLQRAKTNVSVANDSLALRDLSIVWSLLLPQLFTIKGQTYRPHLETAVTTDLHEIHNLLTKRPRTLEVLKLLAIVLQLEGDAQSSLLPLDEALMLASTDAVVLRLRGFARSLVGDHELALDDLKQAVSLHPHSVLNLKILANALRLKGDYSEARQVLARVADHNHSDVYVMICQGDLCRLEHQYQEAQRHFESALPHLDSHPVLLALSGDTHRLLGEFSTAEARFNRALELDPRLVFALVRRADLHLMNGHMLAAKQDLQGAIYAGGLGPYGKQVAAYVQKAEGVAANEADLSQSLSHESHSRDYLLARASRFIEQRHYELAWLELNFAKQFYHFKSEFTSGGWVERIQQALMQSPQNPFLLKSLLYIHLVLKDDVSALHLLEEANQLCDQEFEILILRVCLKLMRGQFAQVGDDLMSLEARFERMLLSGDSIGYISRFNVALFDFAQRFSQQILKEQPQNVEALKTGFIVGALQYGFSWILAKNEVMVQVLSLRPEDSFALKMDNFTRLPRFRELGPSLVKPYRRTFDKELHAFNKILNAQPGDPFALKCLALIHLLSHQFDLVVTTLLQLADDSLDPFDLAVRAAAFHHKEEYALEVRDLTTILAKFPDNGELLEKRALAHLKLGNKPAAAQDIDAVIAQAPKRSVPLMLRALIKRAQLRRLRQREDLALEDLDDFVVKHPTYRKVAELKAEIRCLRGEEEVEVADLELLVSEEPMSMKAKEIEATIRHRRGNYPRALELLNEILQNDHKNWSALEMRGDVHHRLGHFDLALADLHSSLSRDLFSFESGFNPRFVFGKGHQQVCTIGRLDFSLDQLVNALRRHQPDGIEVIVDHERVLRKVNCQRFVSSLLESADPILSNPKNIVDLLNRAKLERNKKLFELARDDLNAVLVISPAHPEALALSALVHAEEGRTQSSADVLVRLGKSFGAAEPDPKLPDVWAGMQKVLEQHLPKEAIETLHAIFQQSQGSFEKMALPAPVASKKQRNQPTTLEELGAAIAKSSSDRHVLQLKRAAIYIEQNQFELAWNDLFGAMDGDLCNFLALFVPWSAPSLRCRNIVQELQELQKILQKVSGLESDALLAWIEFALGHYASAMEIVNRRVTPESESPWESRLDMLQPLIQLSLGKFDDFRELWFWPLLGQEGLVMVPAVVHKLKGDHDLAMQEVEQFLRDESASAWALVMKADLLSIQGRYDEALSLLTRVIKDGEYHYRGVARQKQVEILLKKGETSSALQVIDFEDPDILTSRSRATAYHLTGFFTAALFEILQAMERTSFFALQEYLKEEALLIMQDIHTEIENKPEEGKLFILRALFQAFAGNYSTALKDILHTFNQLLENPENVIDKDVDTFQIEYRSESREYFPIDDPPDRLKERKLDRKLSDLHTLVLHRLERRLQSDPNHLELLKVCAAIRFYKRKDNSALAHLNRVLEISPLDPFALLLRGNIRRLSGRYSLALTDFDLALGADPQIIEALSLRSDVHLAFGNYANAEADCQMVLASQPKNALALKVLEKLQLHVNNR